MADVGTGARAEPRTPPQAARVAALVASFERIGRESMRGLPLYNEVLSVEAVGFERFGDAWLGVLITPWFMNLMLVSDHSIPYSEAANGRKRTVELPGGPVKFLCGGTEEFGMFDTHSIASPMEAYKSQDQARAAARLALTRIRTPPQPASADRPPAAQTVVSRRTLFSFAGRPLSSESSG
jgi:[NiFe] hydrogenase assembly HybE family chaperone